jgi:membrane protease YdiL (CAAX protease family)
LSPDQESRASDPDPGSPKTATETLSMAPPDDGLQRVFFGPQGLRAGWAVLLFATLWWLFDFAAEFLTAPLLRDFEMPLRPQTVLLLESWQVFAVIAATALMARFERRPPLAYGFQPPARGLRFVSGLAWGFIAISLLVFALRALGFLTLSGSGPGNAPRWREAAVWGLVFLLTGVAEEAMFRGYPLFTLTRGIGFWWSALLCSAGFGLMHGANGGESAVGIVAAGAIGLLFSLSLWYTGSLWWAVGFHAAWDWGESYVYGTADSGMVVQGHWLTAHATGPAIWTGGATGPEASILIWPLLVILALGMAVWWGRRAKSPFRSPTRLSS